MEEMEHKKFSVRLPGHFSSIKPRMISRRQQFYSLFFNAVFLHSLVFDFLSLMRGSYKNFVNDLHSEGDTSRTHGKLKARMIFNTELNI